MNLTLIIIGIILISLGLIGLGISSSLKEPTRNYNEHLSEAHQKSDLKLIDGHICMPIDGIYVKVRKASDQDIQDYKEEE